MKRLMRFPPPPPLAKLATCLALVPMLLAAPALAAPEVWLSHDG